MALNALVHAGSHSTDMVGYKRTNISALFSFDGGRTWGGEVMIWPAPAVGGYSQVTDLRNP